MSREAAEASPIKVTVEYNANTRALGNKYELHRDHFVMRAALTELFTEFGASNIKPVTDESNNEHGYLGWVQAVVSGGYEDKQRFWKAIDEKNNNFKKSNNVDYNPYRVCRVG